MQLIHRGKSKTLTAAHRTWLRRRQAVEPAIGHLKADHRMERCGLKGSEGDALHAVLCAARFNIRRLLRAIVRLGLTALFFVLAALASLYALSAAPSAARTSHHASPSARPRELTSSLA